MSQLEAIQAKRLYRIARAVEIVNLKGKSDTDISWGEWQNVTLPSKFGRLDKIQISGSFNGIIDWGAASSFVLEVAFPLITEKEVSGDSSPAWAGSTVKKYLTVSPRGAVLMQKR